MQRALFRRLFFCVVLLSLYHACSAQAASRIEQLIDMRIVQFFPYRERYQIFQCKHNSRCAFEDIYQRAVVLDVNTDPRAFFKPKFVAQALDIYNIGRIQIKNNGATVTGLADLSPCDFRDQINGLIVCLKQLGVLRLTVYKHDPLMRLYTIDMQRKIVPQKLPGVYDYFPESYFLEKEDTAYIATKLEKNPGTSGNISLPE